MCLAIFQDPTIIQILFAIKVLSQQIRNKYSILSDLLIRCRCSALFHRNALVGLRKHWGKEVVTEGKVETNRGQTSMQ